MKVNVNTSVGADRSVTCDITVAGRQVAVTFADGEVTFAVAAEGGDITFQVPESLLAVEPRVTEAYPGEESPAALGLTDAAADLHVDDPDEEAWRQDFSGLLFMGALRGWIEWCGHRISIRTITTDEELLVAQLTREYEGGIGGTKAYATALSGLCVEAVDHHPMPVPLGEHPGRPYAWALERFNYARRWYPPTIDVIFDSYLRLEARQREILAALGKSSAQEDGATPGLSARSGSPSGGAS